MGAHTKLSTIEHNLRCPACRHKLQVRETHCRCTSKACGSEYPFINGIPILIHDKNSVFAIADYLQGIKTTVSCNRPAFKRLLDNISPDITSNLACEANYESFSVELFRLSQKPKVLVVGGGTIGQGMNPLTNNECIEFIETDVTFGPRTMMICDGHDLPFEDEVFDGVIIQAVLEHVANPYRCVEEIHRVLRSDGVVFADTPFMQHGHMGPYDFTRFTHLGHRRLFRRFSEIASGIGCGPGTAFAWAYQNFLISFSDNKLIRAALRHFSNFTSFFLKYFDSYLNRKAAAYKTASSHFFLGRKSDLTLSDRELIKQYRGID